MLKIGRVKRRVDSQSFINYRSPLRRGTPGGLQRRLVWISLLCRKANLHIKSQLFLASVF
jgi:hypothetical protein